MLIDKKEDPNRVYFKVFDEKMSVTGHLED